MHFGDFNTQQAEAAQPIEVRVHTLVKQWLFNTKLKS
jgi:predicted component of type VI protein secretion system